MPKDTEPQHVPTPWQVVKHQDYWRISQKNGFLESEVAICLRKENAAFIVKAVNNHEALFQVAKNLVQWCRENNPNDMSLELRAIINQAHNATEGL